MLKRWISIPILFFSAAPGVAQIVIQSSGGRTVVVGSPSGLAGAKKIASLGEKSEQAADDLEVKVPELTPALAAELEKLLHADDVSPAALDSYFSSVELAQGSLASLTAELAKRTADTGVGRNAKRIAARARRRMGDTAGALAVLKDLAKKGELGGGDLLIYAETLDQSGKTLDAIIAYSQVLVRTEDPALRADLELRLALMRRTAPPQTFRLPKGSPYEGFGFTADGRPLEETLFDPLVELARRGDPETKRRLALVLALTGDARAASDLVADLPAADEWKTALRRAEWSLRADDVPAARRFAAEAVKKAPLARDRRYALSLLVEAWRRGDELAKLADLLAAEKEPSIEEQEVWIELLRQLERTDDAVALLRAKKTPSGIALSSAMRQGLLDICITAGRDAEVEEIYGAFMAAEPERPEWRVGLARYQVDHGRFAEAKALWEKELDLRTSAPDLLDGARVAGEIGLEDLTLTFAERAMAAPNGLAPAALFLANFHLERGRPAEAERTLASLDQRLPSNAPERLDLAEGFERLGKKADAVRVLEMLRKEKRGEDLDIKLGGLLSEVGREEDALALWRELWRAVESVPRRTFVEDRMLAVASRLGKLADIAIDLEQKLDQGKGDELDRGLLVKLYTKANDAVSAAEILEDFGQKAGKPLDALREMSKVYLECNDFLNYEITMRRQMALDPESEPDLMRQLAMSALERARPDVARSILRDIKQKENSTDSEEFEAGVLSIAELYHESTGAYRRALAKWPDHIEAYLLLANDLVAMGKKDEAIGVFRNLLFDAEKDDLYGVAVDGLMNVEADAAVMKWVYRMTLERLGKAPDRMHLYQLLSDIADELGDPKAAQSAVEEAMPLAGERRLPMLRELMDMAGEKDRESLIRYGRRVVALGEQVPPDVFLDLGEAFLQQNEPKLAARTFGLAKDVPDHNGYEKKVAAAFETAGQKADALRVYEKLLVRQPNDVGLLMKVGEVNEEIGKDLPASALYDRAMDLMLARRAFKDDGAAPKKEDDDDFGFGGKNTDSFDEYYRRVLAGVIAAIDPSAIEARLARETKELDQDLERVRAEPKDQKQNLVLDRYPRVRDRADFCRRLAFAFGRPDLATPIDVKLVGTFADDKGLASRLIEQRIGYGYMAASRTFLEAAPVADDVKKKLAHLVGAGAIPTTGDVRADEARRMLLPLIAKGDREALDGILKRIALPAVEKTDLESMPVLVAASLHLGDQDAALSFARRWIQAVAKFEQGYRAEQSAQRCFATVWSGFTDEYKKALAQELAQIFVADPKKTMGLAETIVAVQEALKVELVGAQPLDDLLKNVSKASPWEAPRILKLIPIDKRMEKVPQVFAQIEDQQKIYFFMNILREWDEAFDAKHWDMLKGLLLQAVAAKKEDMSSYELGALASARSNAPFGAAMLEEIHKKYPEKPQYALAYAEALARQKKTDEAAKLASRALELLLGAPKIADYQTENGLSQIVAIYASGDIERMAKIVKNFEEQKGPTVVTVLAKAMIAQNTQDTDRAIAVLREGAERFPKTPMILQRLQSLLQSQGKEFEAIDVQAEVVAAYPERPYMASQLRTAWMNLGNPIRASQIVVKDQRLAARREGAAAIKDAIDAGDLDRARRETRRHLRQFGNEYAYRFASLYLDTSWPSDAAVPERPSDAIPSEFKPKAAKSDQPAPAQKTLWDAIAEQPFGEKEIETFLRLVPAEQLERQGAAIRAWAAARAKTGGAQQTLDRSLARIQEGRAGRIEYAVLVESLTTHPELASSIGPLVDDFLRTAPADDDDTIVRLASLAAKAGRKDAVQNLYRWGIRLKAAAASQNIWSLGRELRALLEEVEKDVPSEFRQDLLSFALSVARPGPFAKRGGSSDFAATALRLAAKVLGVKRALAENPELLKEVLEDRSPFNYQRNESLAVIAGLLVEAGRFDEAMNFIEAIGDGDSDDDEGFVVLGAAGSSAAAKRARISFSSSVLSDILPEIDPANRELEAWYGKMTEKIREWTKSGRMTPQTAAYTFACMALRRHNAQQKEAESATLAEARSIAERGGADRYWMIDILRYCGAGADADRMERTLLDERRLASRRIPAVLKKIFDAGEVERAFTIGEDVARYSPRPELLKVVIAAAEKLEKPDRAAYWKEIGRKILPKEKAFE